MKRKKAEPVFLPGLTPAAALPQEKGRRKPGSAARCACGVLAAVLLVAAVIWGQSARRGTDGVQAQTSQTAETSSLQNPDATESSAPLLTEGGPGTEALPPAGEPQTYLLVNDSGLDPEVLQFGERELPLAALTALCAARGHTGIAVVCSHTSEKCAAGADVREAARLFCAELASRGIPAILETTAFDADGSIGAYAKMNARVEEIRTKEDDLFLLIDFHCSDTERPLTLTVGTDTASRYDNFALAAALAALLPQEDTALRLVPGTVGQSGGLHTLHIGVGGADFPRGLMEEAVREAAHAVAILCGAEAEETR